MITGDDSNLGWLVEEYMAVWYREDHDFGGGGFQTHPWLRDPCVEEVVVGTTTKP